MTTTTITTAPPASAPSLPPSTKLYFAYGSNLSLHQMSQRCPTSSYYALGTLHRYRWIIGERGYANVVSCSPSSSASLLRVTNRGTEDSGTGNEDGTMEEDGCGNEEKVIGMLYLLSEEDEEYLDTAEGVPYAYTKHMLPISLSSPSPETQTVQALVYVDEKRLGHGICKEEYVARMNRGIKDAVEKGMSEVYVREVLRKWVREEEVPGVVVDPYWPYEGEK
ncbi:hypothetical protein G7Y89_g15401 [Cudoniella acicularis]|uniref:gamma-glutamylcyclotransferase n=1 Tax=Cudoniella acicularis TaxID=354080 RepID=A0A8H4VKN7_9HELO|nr:hypothetical protein G7Y89_g15401 [Cudoniella acicularis]